MGQKKKWTDHPIPSIYPSIPSHLSVNTSWRGRLVPRRLEYLGLHTERLKYWGLHTGRLDHAEGCIYMKNKLKFYHSSQYAALGMIQSSSMQPSILQRSSTQPSVRQPSGFQAIPPCLRQIFAKGGGDLAWYARYIYLEIQIYVRCICILIYI